MAFVDLESQYFYHPPPTKTGLAGKERLTASNAEVPTSGREDNAAAALRPGNRSSASLRDYDVIEVLDMTAPEKEPLHPFYESAPDLKDIEAVVGDPWDEVHNHPDLNHSSNENHGDLPSLKQLLSEFNKTQKLERGGQSDEYLTGNFQDAINNDCTEITAPKLKRGENKDELIVLDNDLSESSDTELSEREAGRSISVHTRDGSVSEEKCENQSSPSTPPTSVASTETTCPTLHENSECDTPNTFPPRRSGLVLSTHDTPTYKPADADRNDIESDPTRGENKEDQRDEKEVEADDEEEPDSDIEKENTPLLRSTQKRSLSTAGDKPQGQRRTKRRHFPLPLSSDEEAKTGGELDISSYTPSRPHYTLIAQPTSSHWTGLERDTSDNDKMKTIGRGSRTVVVYKQQSWQGEIIDERDVK